MRPIPFALGWLAAAAACAQTAPQQIVITGNPLQRDALAQPASVLSGDELLRRRASTLGETLDGLPGVAGTWFGPNAGRPVIRGLDGDRVRLLDNGGASVDASSLSFDHAVAIDPLVVERIEVLRGPAALLYGGNATGGVVNTIDNRIPRQAAGGSSGRSELRLGGAAGERGAGALVEGGAGAIAWHADGFTRRSDDLRVPRHVPVADGEALDPATRVRNSAADGEGGALGAAWIGTEGRLGLALDGFRTNYGVTAEPEVTIRMKRDRVRAAGEWRGWSFQAGRTDYRHVEMEGDEVGTTFDSQGRDLRLQGRHGAIDGLQGVFGLQYEALDFSALGEEAFVPSTRTRQLGLFLLETLRLGRLELSGGLRHDRVRVASEGDAADAEAPRFGEAQERRFSPSSLSLGAQWAVAPGWRLQGSLGRTERAPAYHELYAEGLHIATAAYERGDPTLDVERSLHLEGGVAWQQGTHAVSVQAFTTRFSNYIALEATGADVTVDDEEGGGTAEVPEYAFRGVRARLSGLEIEARTGGRVAGWDWGLSAGLDQVRGTQRDSGEPLPRLAPWRARLGLQAGPGDWRLGLDLHHAARQDRVPATDTATPGHTRLDLWARWRQRIAGTELLWTLQARNVGDRLAYSATTIGTLRGLVPLPGRALAGSVQVAF